MVHLGLHYSRRKLGLVHTVSTQTKAYLELLLRRRGQYNQFVNPLTSLEFKWMVLGSFGSCLGPYLGHKEHALLH